MLGYRNILFCTDFSEDAAIGFIYALNLAKKHAAFLHVIHIPHSPFTYSKHIVDEHIPEGKDKNGQAFYDEEVVHRAMEALRQAYEERMGDFAGYRFVVYCGAPEIEIVRYTKEHPIDVIVMGAHGRPDPDRSVHGNTVESVSRYAHCPVMAIRNPAKQFTLPGKMV